MLLSWKRVSELPVSFTLYLLIFIYIITLFPIIYHNFIVVNNSLEEKP